MKGLSTAQHKPWGIQETENNRNLPPHSSRGWKFKITVSVGPCFLWRLQGTVSSMPPSWLLGLWVNLDIHWLWIHYCHLCLRCHEVFSLCMCLSPLLIRTLFQNKVTLYGSGGQHSNIFLGRGSTIQIIRQCIKEYPFMKAWPLFLTISQAWDWLHACMLSCCHVWLLAAPWTVAR